MPSPKPPITSIAVNEEPESGIFDLDWSPSGALLSIGTFNGDCKVWDPISGFTQEVPFASGGRCATAWLPAVSGVLAFTDGSTIHLWDSTKRAPPEELVGCPAEITRLAWSKDGSALAASDSRSVHVVQRLGDRTLKTCAVASSTRESFAWTRDNWLAVIGATDIPIWDPVEERVILRLAASRDPAVALSSSHQGSWLAVGRKSGVIEIWDLNSARCARTLEGHRAAVTSISFSESDRLLGSLANDNEARIWRCDQWDAVAVRTGHSRVGAPQRVAFHPTQPIIALLEGAECRIRVWQIDGKALLDPSDEAYCRTSTAKVVLLGESNIGKSCLSLRLAEDRYEELESTHGMRVWSPDGSTLSWPGLGQNNGDERQLVIWDLGGQPEYRLVHQIFLSDTTVAIFLFDPTRGESAFADVESWDARLAQQMQGRPVEKLLVATKCDRNPGTTHRVRVAGLVKRFGFRRYLETSAKTGQGVPELRQAIVDAVSWESIAYPVYDAVSERIRAEIEACRGRGQVAVLVRELHRAAESTPQGEFRSSDVDAVTRRLALQGNVSEVTLSGERSLVLEIAIVETYICGIVLLARDNPRGVPAVDERHLLSWDTGFPGIPPDKRLPVAQERIALECAVHILLEHGICLRHEGLLIFPELFHGMHDDVLPDQECIVAVHYEFTGEIANAYSSVLASLAMSYAFGRMRLWTDRAEFGREATGRCGIRRTRQRKGAGTMDVYFGEGCPEERQHLFIAFVEDHFRRSGIRLTVSDSIECSCGFVFPPPSLHQRQKGMFADIGCPSCDARVPIGVRQEESINSEADDARRVWALRTQVLETRKRSIEVSISAIRASGFAPQRGYRILHLSDLHLSGTSNPQQMLEDLIADLSNPEDLNVAAVDFLVVSGDLTEHAMPLEFEFARQFISGLIARLSLSSERCVVVPGNHDVNWEENVYEFRPRRRVDVKTLKAGHFKEETSGFLIRNEAKYGDRFRAFGEFYHRLFQRQYPLDSERQGEVLFFPEYGIQFWAMNSSWEMDEHFSRRASINSAAVAKALKDARDQESRLVALRSRSGGGLLRIGVWHHPITGSEAMSDTFMDRLRQAGVRTCLHGHVHEERAEVVGYRRPDRLHVVGA